jgi:hypothetical protein
VRIDANVAIKQKFNEIKKELKVTTEAEVVAYLVTMHSMFHSGLTLRQHNQLLKEADGLCRQQSLDI